MTKKKTSAAPKRRAQSTSQGPNRTLLVVGGIGVLVLGAAVIALALGSATPALAEPAEDPVQVAGTPLPEYPDSGADPAVGQELPTVTGSDMSGSAMTIAPDGRAKAIIILAHQCPHCQAELPRIVAWLADNSVPEGVDVVGISTNINPAGTNYPPSAWFEREGWTQPTLNDDANATAYRAVALGMGTPGWLFVTADGIVQLRTTGELDPADFGAMLEEIAP
jgi:hypothetical protein